MLLDSPQMSVTSSFVLDFFHFTNFTSRPLFRHLDLANLFETVDIDGNGQISKDEFVQVLSKFIPSASEQDSQLSLSKFQVITEDDIAALYEYFDCDGTAAGLC